MNIFKTDAQVKLLWPKKTWFQVREKKKSRMTPSLSSWTTGGSGGVLCWDEKNKKRNTFMRKKFSFNICKSSNFWGLMDNRLSGPGLRSRIWTGIYIQKPLAHTWYLKPRKQVRSLEDYVQSERGLSLKKLQYLKEKENKIRKKSKKISEEIKENVIARKSVSERRSVVCVKYNWEIKKVRTKMWP